MGAVLSSSAATSWSAGDEGSMPLTSQVRDDQGRVHERNPLGGNACLGCALQWPCPTSAGGEQLLLEVGRGR